MSQEFGNDGWKWTIDDPAVLEGWFDHFPELEATNRVKENPVRTVFTVTGTGGTHYYIKHDHPRGWFAPVRAFFRTRVAEEYHAAKLLEDNNVPVVKYLGYGRRGAEGMLISVAEEQTVSGREYWVSLPRGNTPERQDFLWRLTQIVRHMVGHGLYHSDFHAGNILVRRNTGEMLLVDPYGIVQYPQGLDHRKRVEMMKIFVNFRGRVEPEVMMENLIAAGLAVNLENAAEVWQYAIALENRKMIRDWDRRQRQILSGNSKFCCRTIKDGITYVLRQTAFYRPLFDASAPLPPDRLDAVKYSRNEAQQIWLDSFYAQLRQDLRLRVPLIWAQVPDGPDIIYYAVTDDDKRLCGF